MINRLSEKIRSLLSNPNDLRKTATAFGGKVILTSAVVVGVLVAVRQLGAIEGLELQAYDSLLRSRPDQGPDNRLLVVGITEEDIKKLKEYPISDNTLAQTLKKIEEYQPRAIGIDILRDVPQGRGRESLIEVLKQSDKMIAACKLSSANEPGNPAAPGVPQDRIGFADLPLDADVSIRRNILLSTPTPPKIAQEKPHFCNIADPENQVPSLSFLLSMLYLETKGIKPEQTPDGNIKLGQTVFNRLGEKAGGYQKTGATDYQVLLNYRSPQNPAKQVTITELLEGKVDPTLIKDRLVLIGYTAQSTKDDFTTPYSAGLAESQKMPGVLIHAQSVSQILSAVLDNRPLMGYWPLWSEIFWIWGWSVVGGTLAWSIRRPWLFALTAGSAIAVLVGASYGLVLVAVWVPLVPPVLAIVGTALGVVLVDRYSQAIYEGVKKGLLKLNIEIDQGKKEEEITAITETEYFQNLQEKARELRKQKNNPSLDGDSPESDEAKEEEPTEQESESIPEADYFLKLQQKAKKYRKKEDNSSE